MAIEKASKAFEWLTDTGPDRLLMWCEKHLEPVWVYNDKSWTCMWQLIVETGDESQCKLVSKIPTDVLVHSEAKMPYPEWIKELAKGYKALEGD